MKNKLLIPAGAAYLLAATWLLAAEANTQAPQQEGPGAKLGQLETRSVAQQQQQQQQYRTSGTNKNNGAPGGRKCARQSILLARQMLAHELAHINQFNSIWFNDLDREELLEGQKHSLSNIVMSGAGASLLNSNGKPLIEIESSYFRPQHSQPITIKLLRRHQHRCYLNPDKRQFTYVLGLTLGPLEHHLDIVYNLPKDLGLSQPLDWRYGQISLSVLRMNYEITLRQATGDLRARLMQSELISTSGCALEIADVTYLSSGGGGPGQPSGPSIRSYGLAVNNQTLQQVERLFDDYTRPMVSARLRQMLKFYLNTKTLPLAPPSAVAADY